MGIRIDRLAENLIKYEGLKLKPYRCPRGFLTIGVGRNLETRGISQEEALYLLYNDIDDCIEKVEKELPWARKLPEDVKDVLIMMCFQLGIGGLLGFKKFLKALEVGDYEKAAQEMLDSKWAKEDSPKRAEEMAGIIKKTAERG